jgi:hypothetical protein
VGDKALQQQSGPATCFETPSLCLQTQITFDHLLKRLKQSVSKVRTLHNTPPTCLRRQCPAQGLSQPVCM